MQYCVSPGCASGNAERPRGVLFMTSLRPEAVGIMKVTTPIKALMQPELITESESRLMTAARELAVRLHLPTTFVKFLIVGGLGFIVNQFFLFLFYDTEIFWFFPDKHTHWDLLLVTAGDARLLVSSIVAVELAIVFQFNAHERWTFRHRGRSGWLGMRFVKFNVSSAISPIIVVVSTNALTPVLRGTFGDLSPYIANGIGVLLGFSWNWGLNSLVIWPHQKEELAARECR
ncbi:MAG TPA: GtrA family protein [Dehalococcoidia bacterium]|nr:GtrA family protein [Dehalococcoidia bacterium]